MIWYEYQLQLPLRASALFILRSFCSCAPLESRCARKKRRCQQRASSNARSVCTSQQCAVRRQSCACERTTSLSVKCFVPSAISLWMVRGQGASLSKTDSVMCANFQLPSMCVAPSSYAVLAVPLCTRVPQRPIAWSLSHHIVHCCCISVRTFSYLAIPPLCSSHTRPTGSHIQCKGHSCACCGANGRWTLWLEASINPGQHCPLDRVKDCRDGEEERYHWSHSLKSM